MHDKTLKILLLGIVAAVAVTVPSVAQDEDPCLVDGEPFCCFGSDCGVLLADPFDDPEVATPFHCHSVDVEGVECWDVPGDTFFAERCEQIPGFNLQSSQVGPVTAVTCDAAALGPEGGVVGQLLTGVGGYNVFRTQIKKSCLPRIAREREEEEGEDKKDAGTAPFSEITTAAEVEDWTFRGIGGRTPGVRFGWRRQTETGRLFGLSASYQDADPDVGSGSQLFNAHLSYGHTLGTVWSWSFSGSFSDFSGFLDDTLIGATGMVGFSKYYQRGPVLSGGLVLQYLGSDNRPDDVQTAGFGLAFGFPIGRRLTFDLEGYAVSIFEGALIDDEFFTLAGMLSIYATPRFALTLGYRLLEGIDDFDSDTFTFGASTRWG